MLWLALHLPLLSLEAFAATLTAARARAAAGPGGAAPHRRRQRGGRRSRRAPGPQACDRAGAGAGAAAWARPMRARDAAALQAVAQAALAFTPMVVLDAGPATVLLELQHSAALLRRSGPPAREAARRAGAAGPPLAGRRRTHRRRRGAAGALGQGRPRRSASRPAQPPSSARCALCSTRCRWPCSAPAANTGRLCKAWACTGWPTCAALPRSGLARRFGESLLHELDRARGDAPDPRVPLQLPAVFEGRLELHMRADTSDQVLHGAGVLLARLIAWAQARRARIAAFTLRMQHERLRRADADDTVAPCTDLKIELAEPGADPAQLRLLLRERLAHCPLPAPTLALHLHCRHWVQAAGAQRRALPLAPEPARGPAAPARAPACAPGRRAGAAPAAAGRPSTGTRVPAAGRPARAGDAQHAVTRRRCLAAAPPGLAAARTAGAGRTRRVAAAGRGGRCRSSAAPSASRPAGGTPSSPRATTSSPATRTAPWSGSTARGWPRRAGGSCRGASGRSVGGRERLSASRQNRCRPAAPTRRWRTDAAHHR